MRAPFLGAIVLLTIAGMTEPHPAVVMHVHSTEEEFGAVVDVRDLTTSSIYTSIACNGTDQSWSWPIESPQVGELVAGAAPIQGEALLGGFNILSLFGGSFDNLVGPLIVLLYQTNVGRIADGADRIMTVSTHNVDVTLDRLGITDPTERQGIHDAFSAWGHAGGNILTLIAAAKAPKGA